MKALILAAGRGTRINEVTHSKHKSLIDIDGETILQRQIRLVKNQGILEKNIIIVTGYEASSIKELIGNKVTYFHNKNYLKTNSLYSMWLTRNEDFSNGMLLFNSDIIFDKEILIKIMNEKRNVVAVDFIKKLKQGELNVIVENNKILQISKMVDIKEANGESVQICKFDANGCKILFEEAINTVTNNPENQFFPSHLFKFIIKKVGLHAVDIEGYSWGEVDYLQDLKEIQKNKWTK